MSGRRVGFDANLGYTHLDARLSKAAGQEQSGENAVNKAVTAPLPASVLEALARYDTPTICNAMEIVAPERRLIGYTTSRWSARFPICRRWSAMPVP